MESSQILKDDGITNHPQRFNPKANGVLVSSCGFPDMENLALMRQHFKKFMIHIGLTLSGEILIPAVEAVNAPHLFLENMKANRKAGSELSVGVISPETMRATSDVLISKNDYMEMVNAVFKGGLASQFQVEKAKKVHNKP
jgi:hypothetical protein